MTYEMKKIRKIFLISRVTLIILVYFFLSLILKKLAEGNVNIHIYSITLETAAIRGILTQLQMLLTVHLVLKQAKYVYMIAMIINTYSLVTTSLFALFYHSFLSLPGIITYTGTIFVIYLIHRYQIKVKQQMNEIEIQAVAINDAKIKYQEQNTLLANQYQQLQEKEKAMRKMAYFDDLTNILNRKMFIEALDIELDLVKDKSQDIFVTFIDIDNFKTINDTMGHNVGDVVLGELAKRIINKLEQHDIAGRLGGDEIGIICFREISRSEFIRYINEIKEEIIQPYLYENKEFVVTASFGVSIYPDCGLNSTDLLKKADLAMYQSKKSGKNRITFCEDCFK